MKPVVLLIVIFFSAYVSLAQEVRIQGTQTRQISSSIVTGQEYQLQILLPAGYADGNRDYPVVYLMDAQWDFPLMTALYGEQYYDGFMPAVIIVGVTWGGLRPNPDSLRARDYTPTPEGRLSQSGGAGSFLSFLKEELFPFIEKNYRADKHDRTLMGSSLGGLFTLYALFTQPGLFQRYVAASPAVGWDGEVLYQYEKKYATIKSPPSAKLFMCAGGVERTLPAFQRFSKFMENRHYDSLQLETMVLENTGHSGTKAEGFARGLQFVFKRPSMTFDNAFLQKYTGKYRLSNGQLIELRTEDNHLVLYFTATDKYPLTAASEKEFYSKAEFLSLKYTYDESKNSASFDLERYGQSLHAEKL